MSGWIQATMQQNTIVAVNICNGYPDKKIAKSNFVCGVLGSVFETCLKKLFWVVSFPALVQSCRLHSIDPSMSDYPDFFLTFI